MIFNIVGGGSGGALNMKTSVGLASASNKVLTITGVGFSSYCDFCQTHNWVR